MGVPSRSFPPQEVILSSGVHSATISYIMKTDRKGWILLIFLLGGICLKAQNYVFQLEMAPYVHLDNPATFNEGAIWSGEEWDVNIGFPFTWMGEVYTTCRLWEGSLYFDEDDAIYVDGFGASFIDRGWYVDTAYVSVSPVGYQLQGNPGDRIFKIEYRNAGFFDGDYEDYINFQLWLAEATQSIEIRMGPGMVDPEVYAVDGWEGPYIGLANEITNEYLFLEHDPLAPDIYTEDDLTDGLIGTPPEGVVYRFIPDSMVKVQEQEVPDQPDVVVVFQQNHLSLSGNDTAQLQKMELRDLWGRLLGEWELQDLLVDQILLPPFTAGVYTVSFSTKAFRWSQKLCLIPGY
jgi:hypothetical protein